MIRTISVNMPYIPVDHRTFVLRLLLIRNVAWKWQCFRCYETALSLTIEVFVARVWARFRNYTIVTEAVMGELIFLPAMKRFKFA